MSIKTHKNLRQVINLYSCIQYLNLNFRDILLYWMTSMVLSAVLKISARFFLLRIRHSTILS